MLDFTTSQFIQIIIALFIGTGIFLAGYFFSEKYTVAALILIIPFQFIDSNYGSVNMVLTYLLGISLLVKGKMGRLTILFLLPNFAQFTYSDLCNDYIVYLLS